MRAPIDIKQAKYFIREDYKKLFATLLGKHIEVKTLGNNSKVLKTHTGIIDYASDTCFVLKIDSKSTTYVVSYAYKDLYTGSIDYSTIE